MTTRKDFEYYHSLPYRIVLYPAVESGFVVEIPDLPGCISQGEDINDAFQMIEGAKQAWIETALEKGIHIPEPRVEEDYSGKFNVRVPKSLHRLLAERATKENVSLNQLVLFSLTQTIMQEKEKQH